MRGKHLSGNSHVPRLSRGDILLEDPGVGMRRSFGGRKPYVALPFVLETSRAAAAAAAFLLTEDMTIFLPGDPVYT